MKRRCATCHAFLSRYASIDDRMCSPCQFDRWSPERIIWEQDHPHGDEYVSEDTSVVRELRANEVRSALPARTCECDEPTRMEDELGVRCLRCGAWVDELEAAA